MKKEITQKEFESTLVRIHGSGDLDVIKGMLNAQITHARNLRYSEDVYKCPEMLQHWNGVEAGYQTILDLFNQLNDSL